MWMKVEDTGVRPPGNTLITWDETTGSEEESNGSFGQTWE